MPKLLILALVIAAITIGPLLIIWSLNTLFNLNIPYEFKYWFAAAILSSVVHGTSK